MPKEIIEYNDRKINADLVDEIAGTCNGGERVKAKVYAAVSPDAEVHTYLILDDENLGQSAMEVEGKFQKHLGHSKKWSTFFVITKAVWVEISALKS